MASKKIIWHKMRFFSSTAFIWNVSHSRKNSARYQHKHLVLHVKCPYFTIKVTNWCDFCDISLFTFPRCPYMFRAFTSPSSGVSSAAVYVLPLGSCSALLFVCVCSSNPTEGTQYLLQEGQAIQEEFETSGTSCPITQCHIAENFDLK